MRKQIFVTHTRTDAWTDRRACRNSDVDIQIKLHQVTIMPLHLLLQTATDLGFPMKLPSTKFESMK